jgi:biotin carboxylase
MSEKSKAIWLITGGAMQRPVAERIKARNFTLIVSDRSSKCALRPMADAFLHLDIFDIWNHVAAAKKLTKVYDIRAVFTAASDCHETVAHVARHLGLHGIDPAISRICRYKQESRLVLSAAGIPQPRFATASTFREAQQIIKELGLPVCFKATNNAGSRGFTAIHDEKEITEAAFDIALGAGTCGLVLVEELLEALENEIAEQSVETLWYDGKMYWLNWVDRPFRSDMNLFPEIDGVRYRNLRHGIEIGHLNPAVHTPETLDTVREMVSKAGLALGMGTQKGGHIMKYDIMLTKKGPYILEATPRLSGGWDSGGTSIARGGNFVDGAIEMALGAELTAEVFDKYFRYRYSDLHAAVLTDIPDGSSNCIGRSFALATGLSRAEALKNASVNLNAERWC